MEDICHEHVLGYILITIGNNNNSLAFLTIFWRELKNSCDNSSENPTSSEQPFDSSMLV